MHRRSFLCAHISTCAARPATNAHVRAPRYVPPEARRCALRAALRLPGIVRARRRVRRAHRPIRIARPMSRSRSPAQPPSRTPSFHLAHARKNAQATTSPGRNACSLSAELSNIHVLEVVLHYVLGLHALLRQRVCAPLRHAYAVAIARTGQAKPAVLKAALLQQR